MSRDPHPIPIGPIFFSIYLDNSLYANFRLSMSKVLGLRTGQLSRPSDRYKKKPISEWKESQVGSIWRSCHWHWFESFLFFHSRLDEINTWMFFSFCVVCCRCTVCCKSFKSCSSLQDHCELLSHWSEEDSDEDSGDDLDSDEYLFSSETSDEEWWKLIQLYTLQLLVCSFFKYIN